MRGLIDCRKCPRLSDYLIQVKQEYPDYYCKPVLPYGPPDAKLLIVGLAPGKHGANATGKAFTGDSSGTFLFQHLHEFGFALLADATSWNKQQRLFNCRITNAVKCLPPQNKPKAAEINQCNQYLREEILTLSKGSVVLALGTLAHQAIIKALQFKKAEYPFNHAAEYALPNELMLIDSYHCSRYNTQTKRLTAPMFNAVFKRIDFYLNHD